MRPKIRHVIAAITASAVLAVIGSSSPSSFARSPVVDASPAETGPATKSRSAGRQWFMATRAALDNPQRIHVPFVQRQELAGRAATAFAFKAFRGQTLELTLGRDAAELDGARVYVEVFRVVDVLDQPLRERLTAMRAGAQSLRTRLPSDGTYHVLVQADAEAVGQYRLTIELDAALPFPVVGAHADSIRSLFGASRDDGTRSHAGVDIFVQRLTPVLAVAAGQVMPSADSLGGNTVWLNTPGTSYYYAHLDRVAVKAGQRVKAGDVLGYVGNTGNARKVASHLHFGVYRWGKDPIDPLPLILGQRLAGETAATSAAGAGG